MARLPSHDHAIELHRTFTPTGGTLDIYIIRHSEAVELGTDGITNDFDRPLTEAGRKHSQRLATALPARGARIERIFVSPLVRTQQTAEPMIAAWSLQGEQVVSCEELAPGGSNKDLAEQLTSRPARAIALVGHRPDLNEFTAWLIGSRKAQIAFSKGAVALVRIKGHEVEKGSGELLWLLPPDWV